MYKLVSGSDRAGIRASLASIIIVRVVVRLRVRVSQGVGSGWDLSNRSYIVCSLFVSYIVRS